MNPSLEAPARASLRATALENHSAIYLPGGRWLIAMTVAPARYDLIVIGAGINGAAIAREAALTGSTVLLLEQDDLGSGTSAASTRLIHGGLRYLEHAELGLVYESLHERERLLRFAPHLVTPLGIYLPLYRAGRKRWQIRAGMWLYDLLSLGKSVPGHRMLDEAAVLEALPGLARVGLVGAARYYDAQVRFPERLVVELVRDAVANGAELRAHTRVTRIDVVARRARGVEWRHSDGTTGRADAPCIVNATGPWVDRVLGELAAKKKLLGATKGSHLVCKPFPGAPAHAVYAEAASDGRPFFVVPWNDLYLIGTTDERFEGDPAETLISADEYRYLVEATEKLFPAAAPLDQYVCYTQAGIRPLPRSSASRTAAITRRHLIYEHRGARGLFSIVGGKLTTHRALAEDVLHRVSRHAGRPFASRTRERPLPGALDAAARDELVAALGAELGADQAARLWQIYGAQSIAIGALARSSKELAMVLGAPASPIVAELVHAVREEWASSLADILLRRCMAGLGAERGLDVAPAAADWLVRLGFWDKARGAHEVESYGVHVRRFARPKDTSYSSTVSKRNVGRSPRRE